MRTVKDWLAIPEQDLPVELATVRTLGPWKHKLYWNGTRQIHECLKCKRDLPSTVAPTASFLTCSVPDPITIDWNTAMEWRDKTQHMRFYQAMKQVLSQIVKDYPNDYTCGMDYGVWVTTKAQPKHYLIAAAMAAERKEE